MAIKKGDIIKVEYTGMLEDGSVFDSTEKNGGVPIKFEVGAGKLIKGFDDAVVGKEVDAEFEVSIEPTDAYGEYREGMSQVVPKDQFPKEAEPKEGMMIMVMGPGGRPMPASIGKVEEDNVTIDLNHPLAGQVLKFKIKILETGCEPDPPEACGCGCGHDHSH